MNRHITPTPPYTNGNNGHYETPLDASGVSLHRPSPQHQPTTFAADPPLRGVGPFFYALHHFHLGGLPASRYLAFLWLSITILAALGVIPGGWITITLVLLLWGAQIVLGLRYQRQQYVSFASTPLPALTAQPLEIADKLPIFATGLLNVEGRYKRYTLLPGFYRTFATSEHALLCRVQERSWLAMLSWPREDSGMWYAFIHPNDIHRLSWGEIRFGSNTYPAVAVEYQLEIPSTQRRKNAEIRSETVYLACADQDSAQRLYVDLLQNLPADKIITSIPVAQ